MVGCGCRPCSNLGNPPGGAFGVAALVAIVFGFARTPAVQSAPLPASLSYPTKEAFERYVALTDARNTEELRQGSPFLWVDALPEARRAETYAAMKRGELMIERVETRNNGTIIEGPEGLIHHWIGPLWLPASTLPQP